MYLTKIDLALNNRTVCAALGDCQKMHRLLNGLFDSSRQGVQLLYRVRNRDRDCCVYLYSNCPICPDKLLPFMTLEGQRDLSGWLDSMKPGRRFRFDLLTMPSKKEPQENGKNSRRRVLKTQEERLAWLKRQAAQNGFALLQTQELETVGFSGKHPEEQGGRMGWSAYHYIGILEIRDAEAFCKAMERGIGPEKAYGLGMILLA